MFPLSLVTGHTGHPPKAARADTTVRCVVLASRPQATVRLYCLPPAGCGPEYYEFWTQLVPPWVELCSIELPGRGRRSHQPSLTDPDQCAAHIAEALESATDPRPYALFGHSVGAFLAYIATCHLQRVLGRMPNLLAVSALPAPHLDAYTAALPSRLAAGLDGLSDFVGPIPENILNTPEAATACTAILADLLMLLHYRHHTVPQLEVPLALYGGDHDPLTSQNTLVAWNDLVTASTTPRLFTGAHTYPNQHAELLVHHLTDELSRYV
ncbi:thioesterase II family protein [Streptomyces niger]|uniref:thioesterase II family protein n=1 Tax=Streptomyces niger TaxID=66373 RepID=UPI001F40FAC8|nr:alpha/beta fold hydrolase [Streptomyces niger]